MAELQALPGDKLLSPPLCRVAHAWLSADVYALLQLAADRRRIHVDHLARLIIMQHVDEATRAADIG